MSTIREQIVAAAVTALTTGRPAGVSLPVRTRIDSPDAEELPALTIYQALEKVEPMHDERLGRTPPGPVLRRYLDLVVEILTKAGVATEPDKAADPLIAWVTKAMAAADKFGGLANFQADEIGTQFAYEQKETSFCRATMVFRIRYQTSADNAEALT